MSGYGIGNEGDGDIKALWASVMYRAIMDWIGCSDEESRRLREEYAEDAGAWFSSDEFEPGSFLWICQVLGIHHSVVRKQLRSRPELREIISRQGHRLDRKVGGAKG